MPKRVKINSKVDENYDFVKVLVDFYEKTEKNLGLEEGTVFIGDSCGFLSSPFKFKVEEVTDTTYLFTNLDRETTFRILKTEFHKLYNVIEVL